MNRLLPLLVASLAFPYAGCAVAPTAGSETCRKALDAYDITWTSQSRSPIDSMPLSGNNLAINVWVQNGELFLMPAGPDVMNENGMQVKLGLVRVKFDHAVFSKDFRQTLHVATGEMEVRGATEDGKAVVVTLRCDAKNTVAYAEVRSETPLGATVSYESWSGHKAVADKDGLRWVRRLPEVNQRRLHDMKAQSVAEFADKVPDPLSKLTLGGRIDAAGLAPAGDFDGTFNGMKTHGAAVKTVAPVTALDLTFTFRAKQDDSLAAWEEALSRDAAGAVKNFAASRDAARARWAGFWDRSHIVIDRTPGVAAEKDKPWQAARNYQLVRYTMAANASGKGMTLFNGGLFASDGNPDHRVWDGCQYMGQNQMLVYWPMQRAGDFDLLRVGCDFYRDRIAINRAKAKKLWGIDGLNFNEPFSIFGLDAIGADADGRSTPSHLHYHYTSGMTFSLMMLGHDSYTGTITPGYADAAYGLLSYYDQYYRKKLKKETGSELDAKGKLVIYPSDACEPYHGCTNNTDVLAGLNALSRDLLAAAPGTITPAQRSYIEEVRKRIPDYTFEEKNGRKFYAAAAKKPEWVFSNGNMDFPQMYICFPFSAVSYGRSDMTLVKNTWDLGPVNPGVQHQNQCWYQTAINFARMGETVDAADYTLKKLLHAGRRFPSFYHVHYAGGGEGFCATPDMDHGGVAMTALQEMIMQTDGKRILLGVAWPAQWNADFKLHAPYATVVEGRVADGKVIVDKVTPESRRKDIEIFPLKALPPPEPTPLSEGKAASASAVFGGGYEAAKALDGDETTRWASRIGDATGWLEVDLGAPMSVSRAVMMEKSYPGTREFAVEALQPDGSWKSLAEGTTIGSRKEVAFPATTAQRFRLNIKKQENASNIEEFRLFGK